MATQVDTEKDILQQAHEAEIEEHFNEAAELYQKVIKRHPLQAHAYDRLMIIYRKLKKYKEELDFEKKDIPYFFVLDADGKIVFATNGAYSDAKMESIEAVIEN